MKNNQMFRNAWQQLSVETGHSGGISGGSPPGGVGRAAMGMPPSDPSLTHKFNQAAKKPVLYDASQQPVYKQQIDLLKRQLSQPRHTNEMSPLGSVLRSRNVEKDRRLMHTMAALTERLNKQKGLSQRFATAKKKGHAKQQFNQAARGMGM